MVSQRSRAGWSAGMFSAWKLSSSLSTSGLSTTTKPNCPKMRAISRSVSGRGCSEPRQIGRPGSVTSSASWRRRCSRVSAASSTRRAARAVSIASRTGLASAPTRGRSSAARAPMPARISRSSPLRPRMPDSTASSATGEAAAEMAADDRACRSSRRAWKEATSTTATGSAGRYWDLATSAMRVKVAASRTQMSARILRSISTPADLRPLTRLP